MKNFHVKSVILGIGLGIILTSFTSLVFVAGMKPEAKLNKEEVLELAKKYGMVDGTKLIKEQEPTIEKKAVENISVTPIVKPKTVAISTPVPTVVTPIPTETPLPRQENSRDTIAISVNSGDVSEVVANRLKSLGIINDAAGFLKEIRELGLESSLMIGDYKIPKGTDVREIIRIITKK